MMLRLLFKQLLILLWKYWIVRVKNKLTTVSELIGPLFLPVLIAYLYANSNYNKDPNKWKDHIIYDATMVMDNLRNNSLNFTHIIFFTPNNPVTSDIIDRVVNYHRADDNIARAMLKGGLKAVPQNNVDDMYLELRKLISENILYTPYISGIIFDESIQPNVSLPLRLNYTIMSNGFKPTHVNKLFGRRLVAGPDIVTADAYPNTFCKLQSLINEVYLTKLTEQYQTTRNKTTEVIKAFKYPYPKYRDNGDQFFEISIQELIGGSIVLSYIITCPLIVKRITDEKYIKAKELMRMIGMSDWVFWLSHFISFFTIMLFHNFIFILLFYEGLGGEPIYQYMDISLFFFILLVYNFQNLLYNMLISTVFNQPVIAVVATTVLYLTSFAIPLGLTHPAIHVSIDVIATNHWRLLSCFLPNLGIVWCLAVAGQYEVHSQKLGWGQLISPWGVYGYLNVGSVLILMIASSLIYGFLIWYIDAVWPFQYGVPKPLYFPCQPSYYCPKEKVRKQTSIKEDQEEEGFEAEPVDLKPIVKIKNLVKIFGDKKAVDDISLNIFRGQITALLGHNGAGKSTTMSMMTGIYPPTSGTIMINGYSVITNTNKARKSIGLCPQENVIYEDLTVRQHLKLYAVLKDYSSKSVEKEVDSCLKLLRLDVKKDDLAVDLSGGMKRRLQLGIAIIGGTKILILDEPTSGLDPEARRVIWDVLQNMRENHTIVLTTHYMEEADAIADRIAIMSSGKIKCCGSPMFLKKKYGGGYHLRIAKSEGYDSRPVEELICEYLPESEMEMDIGTEVIYSLETNSQRKARQANKSQSSTDSQDLDNKQFVDLFKRIEIEKQNLKIYSFGVSLTSLEEVFINVLQEEEEKISKENLFKVHDNLRVTGSKLFYKQIYGLIMKRVHFSKRYWPIFIFQILLPAFLFMIILIVDYKMRNIFKNWAKDMTIDLQMLYGNTTGFFEAKNSQWLDFGREIYKPMGNKHGMNVVIMNASADPNEWAINHSRPVETYVKKYLIGAAIGDIDVQNIEINFWFSNEAIHSLPISINMVYESLVKYFIPQLRNEEIHITVENKPLGMSEDQMTFPSVIFSYIVTCLLLTPITVPFLGASFILFPIHERATKAKLLQLMTGLSPLMFWLCNFFFDMISHLFAVTVIFIVFMLFDFNNTYFGQSNTAIGLLLMLFFFGVASIPAAYCFSFIFKKSSSGYAILVMIYLFFGLTLNLVMSIFDIYQNVKYQPLIPEYIFNAALFVLRLFPVFSMCFGIQKLYRTGAFNQQCRSFSKRPEWDFICKSVKNRTDFFYGCCKDHCQPTNDCYDQLDPFTFNNQGVGPEFIYLTACGLGFIFLLWLIEINFFKICYRKWWPEKKEKNFVLDPDVVDEENRIQQIKAYKNFSSEALVVYKLTKHFKQLTAVNRLSFAVHREECFGLLGVNGAGKTTTFAMLTGDLAPDGGNAYIGKHNLMDSLSEFEKNIGFCPQFDPLLDKLTAKEMLYLFARLRGVRSSLISSEVMTLIKMVDLEKYANRCTENYSGGNKRKLSLALAIIGNPPVIFLDEPTAGVDPFARRKIWTALDFVRQTYKSSLILTSHSMQESEALCGRIAIMVAGRFTCLGSIQHLRSKFGQGFSIDIKLKQKYLRDTNYKQNIEHYIKQKFSSVELKGHHQLVLHYHISDPNIKWSYIFDTMENGKRQLKLEDYNVCDTSLEQIFLTFALTQYKTNK